MAPATHVQLVASSGVFVVTADITITIATICICTVTVAGALRVLGRGCGAVRSAALLPLSSGRILVARSTIRVFVRHRSATLLNHTANAWVHYVKMERAWRPLLAFQVCRVFLRRCARTQSICERRLRRNVAAVRLQAAARGYVLRRARGEAHAATAVAAWWRGRQQWRRYRLLNASAIRIETAQRRSSVQATYWWISEKRSRRFAQSAVKQGFAVRDGIMGSRAWHPDHDFPMAEGLGHRHAHHAYLPTR